jgi:hypothetical protein
LIKECVRKVSNRDDGWLCSFEDIDFYDKSGKYDMMKTEPQKRKEYIGSIADKMHEEIEKFIQIAKENNL